LAMLSRRWPAMLVLLAAGLLIAVADDPARLQRLAAQPASLHWPTFAWPALSMNDLWLGAILLALPQLPLTFGNALLAVAAENDRLFPDRPVSLRRVAWSTGLMNLASSATGGVPMCHGAGGLAAHVRFGARTGGATMILGACLRSE